MGIDEISVVFRGIERLTITGAAILALYYGYKLFKTGIETEQAGEFSGKNFTVKLIKVGPGIFFALFSTSVLITIALQNIKLTPPAAAPQEIEPNPDDSSKPKASKSTGLTSFFGAQDSSALKRQLEMTSEMKARFQSGDISKDTFLSSINSLQKTAAKIYVGKEIYEKCEFNSQNSTDADCRKYLELIK